MMKMHSRVAQVSVLVALAAAGTALAVHTAQAHGSTTKTTTSTGMAMGKGMPMPMPIQPIGQALWQGMKIQGRLSTPLPFVVFEGTSARMVKPTKKEDVHLMVMLSDAHTGAAIPYGSVWATVRKAGRIVFDERLWPMISRYMGTHFGNNVALPGSGTYTLSLLIGPPQAARHIEYSKVWLKPHRVSMTFHWSKPK
jgi:uncharacterized protein involved in high-affinity Fe2+ transport